MDLPVSVWLAAAAVRRSRRSFARKPLDEERLARLERVCRDFRPFPEARVELVREPVERVATGIVGGYGRVSGAPGYLAIIGAMASIHVQECAGYTGEGLILEATSLGLGTCWVGGFFKPDAAARSVRRPPGSLQSGPEPAPRQAPAVARYVPEAISSS